MGSGWTPDPLARPENAPYPERTATATHRPSIGFTMSHRTYASAACAVRMKRLPSDLRAKGFLPEIARQRSWMASVGVLAGVRVQVHGALGLRTGDALGRQSNEHPKNLEIGRRTERAAEMACGGNARHPAPLPLLSQLRATLAAHREEAGS